MSGTPLTLRQTETHQMYITDVGQRILDTEMVPFEPFLNHPQAEVIKQNLQRTIRRIPLKAATVYLKECSTSTPRAWLRDFFRPPKAQLEFENALRLQRLGVPTIQALAWVEIRSRWPGTSWIITREQPDTQNLDEYITEVLPRLSGPGQNAAKRRLAHAFAHFLAQVHDAGIIHPDLHPGNCLIECPPSQVPRLYLLDVHSVQFANPLTWPQSRENLVLLNRWFQMRASRTDRLRFWRTYIASRSTLLAPAKSGNLWPEELETATVQSSLHFWNRRMSRYRSNNRQSIRVQSGTCRGYAVRDWDKDHLAAWLAEPDRPFQDASAVILKDSRSSTVAQVYCPGLKRVVLYKRFRCRGFWSRVKNRLRTSSALRSWLLGWNLRDRDLPTPQPLAMFHDYRSGWPGDGYLVTEFLEECLPLSEAVEQFDHHRVQRLWIESLAKLIAKMHLRQVQHRDLKAPNILLNFPTGHPEDAKPFLIDLVGVRVGRKVTRTIRVRDLARLNTSFWETPRVSRTDRLRFLRGYLLRMQHWANWKMWWKEIELVTLAKVERNQRMGRPIG